MPAPVHEGIMESSKGGQKGVRLGENQAWMMSQRGENTVKRNR